jgi:low affinity Fe/Cu permease
MLKPGRSPGHRDHFGALASEVARLTGMPAAFMAVSVFVMLWALGGFYFHFSEVWLLFINTVCTIVTTLVVFLIQNTQNRDTLALQLKLAELILVMEGAEPKMALAEDLSHQDLEELKEKLRKRTQEGE